MSELDKFIENAKTICITGHKNPDGDCVGSILALYNYVLNKYGNSKKVKPYLENLNKKYLIVPNADKISTDTNDAIIYDLGIIVDCSDEKRPGDVSRYFIESKRKVVIDHHERNVIEADLRIVDPAKIATCELLYSCLDEKYINKDVAISLYLGIATDSGGFKYQATTRNTMEIAGKLMDYGFNFTKLLDSIVNDCSLNLRRAQALVINRIKLYDSGTIAFSYITDEDIEEIGVDRLDLDSMINFVRDIIGVKVACFAYPLLPKVYKLSLRSKDDSIDVSKFAMLHNGGGHKLAAGCTYNGDIDVVKENYVKDMREFVNGN